MNPALPVKFKPYTRQTIAQAPQWERLSQDLREAILVVSRVLPFRTNEYVMNELIDWDNIPNDPIYRLVFPRWDDIEAIEKWPTVNPFTWKAICRMAMDFDKIHHPDVVNGGLWMNNGFSTVDGSALRDWHVSLEGVKVTYKTALPVAVPA